VPAIEADLTDAARHLDRDALASVPSRVRESVHRALSLIDAPDTDTEHAQIAREVRRVSESGGSAMTELIVRAAALRHFLG